MSERQRSVAVSPPFGRFATDEERKRAHAEAEPAVDVTLDELRKDWLRAATLANHTGTPEAKAANRAVKERYQAALTLWWEQHPKPHIAQLKKRRRHRW